MKRTIYFVSLPRGRKRFVALIDSPISLHSRALVVQSNHLYLGNILLTVLRFTHWGDARWSLRSILILQGHFTGT